MKLHHLLVINENSDLIVSVRVQIPDLDEPRALILDDTLLLSPEAEFFSIVMLST